MEAPDRHERLIVMNTVLSTGRFPLGEGFLAQRAWVNANSNETASCGRHGGHWSRARDGNRWAFGDAWKRGK